jgi:hypothetical protein
MAITKAEAYRAAVAADGAWHAELVKTFGRAASNARYEKRGRGDPGTALQVAHDAWTDAMMTARALGVVP